MVFLISLIMAIVGNTLTGFLSGSIGLDTFQDWKNRHIMRSKPVVQYNPNTPAQQANRIRFNGVRAFYGANVHIIEPIMRRMDRKRAPFNAFAHRNLKLWSKGASIIDLALMGSLDLGVGSFHHLDYFRLLWSEVEGWIWVALIPHTEVIGYESFWISVIVYNRTKNVFWNILRVSTGTLDFERFYIDYDSGDVVVGWLVYYSFDYSRMSMTHFVNAEIF